MNTSSRTATAPPRWAHAATTVEIHHAPPDPHPPALATALRRLPPDERRVVIMHYLADLSVCEISTQSGTPENIVRARLHRGRTALAAALREGRKEVGHV